MSQLRVDILDTTQGTVVVLQGDAADEAGADVLGRHLDRLAASGARRRLVVLDLSAVTSLGRAAVSRLVNFRRAVRHGCEVALAAPAPAVLAELRAARLHCSFPIHPTVGGAIAPAAECLAVIDDWAGDAPAGRSCGRGGLA